MTVVTPDEWSRLARRLESHHSIFYKMWSSGTPVFTEDINTAAVEFDRVGNCLRLCFNPSFWGSLSEEGKLFAIGHEMLHVILNHGKRCKGIPSERRVAGNICMDVVVNHLLVNGFGFDKDAADASVRAALGSDEVSPLCWVGNVFDGLNLPDDECFEFYYSQYLKSFGDGNSIIACRPNSGCLDDHSSLPQDDMDSLMQGVASGLSRDELHTVFGIIKKHKPGGFAGTAFGSWALVSEQNTSRKKRSWESVIKKWERATISEDYGFGEQWTRRGRRHASLSKNIFLPCDVEAMQMVREDNSVEVLFFLDTSGSCWDLRERFLCAARSLNRRRFDAKIFCFDTAVAEITSQRGRVYGGGGTSFRAVAQKVKEQVHGRSKHPHVFILTDGYGDEVSLERPERWHWFITKGGTASYIDSRCHVHRLEDYD